MVILKHNQNPHPKEGVIIFEIKKILFTTDLSKEARQILIGKKREGAMIREALVEFTDEVKKDYGRNSVDSKTFIYNQLRC
jgi:hypothetical protein